MGKFYQFKTALSCSLGNAILGVFFVWPSYTLNLYTDKNTTLLSAPMSDVESSLVGSIPSLGAMVGSVLIGIVLSTFGRKNGGILTMLPVTISWLVVDLTNSSIVILLARFISGIAAGGLFVHSPIFISEVVDESIRGMLASAPMTCYCVGLLVSYILGWTLSYRYIIWVNIALTLVYIALMMTVRESPIHLMRNNKEEEAIQSLAHYRGVSASSKIVQEEISRIKQMITPAVELVPTNQEEAEKAELNEEEKGEAKQKMPSYKLLFVSPSSRRAFTVVAITLTLQVLTGMVAVQIYAKQIFVQAAPSLSSHFCSVMLAAVLLFGGVMNSVLADRCGRRMLLISAAVIVTFCLVALGVLMQTEALPAWVTAVVILIFCFAFMFGVGSIPYVLLAEAFIPEVQSFASMILMEWVWFLNFVLVGIFPFMVKLLDIYGSFYCFTIFAALDVLVGIFMVPETKGLTSEQIQEAFLRRRVK